MTKPKAKQRARKRATKTVSGSSLKIPGFYYPTGLTPEEFFKQLGRTRRDVAAEIERLITFLDNTGGCPDLEDDEREGDLIDDEPSLGSTGMTDQGRWAQGGLVGARDVDLELDRADNEPSLGALGQSQASDQTNWERGATDDREDEHDGREPDEADTEPSLGATECVNQSRWGIGGHWLVNDAERGTTRRMTPEDKQARSKGPRQIVITQGGKPYRLDPIGR